MKSQTCSGGGDEIGANGNTVKLDLRKGSNVDSAAIEDELFNLQGQGVVRLDPWHIVRNFFSPHNVFILRRLLIYQYTIVAIEDENQVQLR